MVAPDIMAEIEPGNITLSSIRLSLKLSIRAESIIFLSISETPFKVFMKIGQKAPKNIMNIDAALNVGKIAIA